MRGLRGWIAAVVVLAGVGLVPAPPARAAGARPGITVVHDAVVSQDGRLHELTLHSAVLGRDTRVRILLPAHYAGSTKRYPMLLLLHGAGGDQRSWTASPALDALTAGLGLIVVMPAGGATGFYSDWLDGPQWETHHLDELVPWVDATYRTIGTREGRAVAGLSMGGFGSMAYAARHPDRFVAAAAFSGAVNIADLDIAEAAALQALGYGDDRRWGPYLTDQAIWRGHNPPDLASNLRGMSLRLTTGTGVPCAGDDAGAAFLEAGVFAMNVGFEARLGLAGVPYTSELRPCGTHEWHYWEHDIATWLPMLMAAFAHPSPRPAAFDYRTTDARSSVWGWSFTAHRPAAEFLDLTQVSAAGLTATGSGLVDVVTAPLYRPGAAYQVAGTTAGALAVPLALVPALGTLPADGATATAAVAGPDGRLAFTLDLGPAHTANQFSSEAFLEEGAGIGRYFRTAKVTIAPAASAALGPARLRSHQGW